MRAHHHRTRTSRSLARASLATCGKRELHMATWNGARAASSSSRSLSRCKLPPLAPRREAEPRRAEAAIPTLRTDIPPPPPGPPPRGRVLRRAVCQSRWASVGSQSALHNPPPDQKWGPAAAVAYNPQVEAAATGVT